MSAADYAQACKNIKYLHQKKTMRLLEQSMAEQEIIQAYTQLFKKMPRVDQQYQLDWLSGWMEANKQ